MTAATVVPARPAVRRANLISGRMLRIELRRSAMLWLLPVAIGLFWFDTYRKTMAMPPLWNLRAMNMQQAVLLNFEPAVVGAAAWMGWRDSRRRMTDLVAATARSRWARQLTTWAATTIWAVAGYLGCVGVVYLVTARQAASGGPLWWPAVVGLAGIPLLAAVGYIAGAVLPSRFTTPLVTVITFFALGFSTELAHSNSSLWQISPGLSGSFNVGPDPGLAVFYHYLPDLAIAQVMFLAGLTAVLLGLLGVPTLAGSRWLRGTAAAATVVGALTAVTALALVSTARLDPNGMIDIPALHDAANDQPIRYTPVCEDAAIAVCLNPAYRAYLPVVTAALRPVLSQVAGLPGAPGQISQAVPVYQQGSGNGIMVRSAGLLALPGQLPGQGISAAQFAAQVRSGTALAIVDQVVGDEQSGTPAQQAVAAALLTDAGVQRVGPGRMRVGPGGIQAGPPSAALPGPARGTAVYVAARRFAALPAAARHAWLMLHLAALRAGRLSLRDLP